MASNWQPIESAPRDGTWVLVKGGNMGDEWYGKTPEPPCVVAFSDSYAHEEWGFADWDGACRSYYLNPTHWMPLPHS